MNRIYPFLHNIHPNTLTLLGIIPPLLFFIFIINHWYVLAIVAFIGNVLDLLDGMIARKYNKVTALGGFLDSTFDRISDFLIITAFAFAGLVQWEIVTPLLLLSFLISYTRSRGELANPKISFAIGLIERLQRLIIIISALVSYMLLPNIRFVNLNIAEVIFIILSILSLYTFIQRILYACKNL